MSPKPPHTPLGPAEALLHQARLAGLEHLADLLRTLDLALEQSREVVDGQAIYPPLARDVCERLIARIGEASRALHQVVDEGR